MYFVRLTVHFKLQFGPTQNSRLAVYTDTDWAGQRSDRKSTSSGVAILYGGPVCWLSKLQRLVAMSSIESEYIVIVINAKTT